MVNDFRNRIRVLSGSEDTSPFESSGTAAQPVLERLPENALLTSFHCEGEDEACRECRVVIPQSAYEQVTQHLSYDTTREHGGFLLGYEIKSGDSQPPTVIIERAVPAKHTQGSPVRLTFTTEAWREFDLLTDKLRQSGLNLQRVGWYHSHPDISIFLSRWDLDVCKTFDRRSYPVALVVDPIGNRGGVFIRKKSGYEPHRPQGFEELHDLAAISMVTWGNMSRTSGPAAEAPITQIAQMEIVQPEPILPPKKDVYEKKLSESAVSAENAAKQAAVTTARTRPELVQLSVARAMVLLAIVAALGFLYINQRDLSIRIDQLAAEQHAQELPSGTAPSDTSQPNQKAPSQPAVVSVTISPEATVLAAGQRQEFKVRVEGPANDRTNWSTTPPVGTISADGVYTAPSTISSQQKVAVRATSIADPTKFADGAVTLMPTVAAEISVEVEPSRVMLKAGGRQQFIAHVKGAAGSAKWTLEGDGNPGQLSAKGEYTAPDEVTQQTVIKVVATSTINKKKSGAATITLQPAEPGLPDAK